ncbi:MAG: hypothetical protein RLZZ393_42 [Pseudomonadota bacterium]
MPLRLARAAENRLTDDPFRLGLASGFPTAGSVVLWTRLAPRPLDPDAGMPPRDFTVGWEIALDERMAKVVARGSVRAAAAWSHSVHVEARGLQPARDYWYRFTAAGHQSPIGRTRTLPAAAAVAGKLDFAVVCCQNYEHGHYAGYGHIVGDAPDLVLHLGDYIYEYGVNERAIRRHNSPEIRTLSDYRARYALYHGDPQLQAAHAIAPWLLTWDDHEVENDYAGVNSNDDEEDPAAFIARRTAAYRAYFENLPLPPSAAPRGTAVGLHARRQWGSLANFHVLDQRQYRSPKACMKDYPAEEPPALLNCEAMYASDRTMLGLAQERWLDRNLAASSTDWNILVQGTMVSTVDEQPGSARRYSNDNWGTYRAARDRLVASLEASRARNPVVLTGDVHAFVVGQVTQDAEDPSSAAIAPEFVATSLTSNSRPQRLMQQWLRDNANLRYAAGETRGYLKCALSAQALSVELMAIDEVKDPQSGRHLLKRYTVEAGSPAILA